MFPFMAWAIFVIVFPVAGWYVTGRVRAKSVQASFAQQTVSVDGVSLPASRLTVLYRSRVSGERWSCYAQWICRGPDSAYLLAIVTGQRFDRWNPMRYTWTWRRLTEERARHALLVDRAAYAAAFGSKASDAPAQAAHDASRLT